MSMGLQHMSLICLEVTMVMMTLVLVLVLVATAMSGRTPCLPFIILRLGQAPSAAGFCISIQNTVLAM